MSTERIRSLIIDDEEFVRLVVEQALREEGCDTRTASGGQEGLDLANRYPMDLILLDVVMPGIDGFALIQQYRENVALAHVPVIVMSPPALTCGVTDMTMPTD